MTWGTWVGDGRGVAAPKRRPAVQRTHPRRRRRLRCPWSRAHDGAPRAAERERGLFRYGTAGLREQQGHGRRLAVLEARLAGGRGGAPRASSLRPGARELSLGEHAQPGLQEGRPDPPHRALRSRVRLVRRHQRTQRPPGHLPRAHGRAERGGAVRCVRCCHALPREAAWSPRARQAAASAHPDGRTHRRRRHRGRAGRRRRDAAEAADAADAACAACRRPGAASPGRALRGLHEGG